MIPFDEKLLKSMVTLSSNEDFNRFMEWIVESKREYMEELITARGERRDHLQGILPEMAEIINTVEEARKHLKTCYK